MNEIKYNKLVRDKIPDIITESQRKCKFRVLNFDEYKKELLAKLTEEANELVLASSRDHIIEEFADVYQVLEDLALALNISVEEINAVKSEKKLEKGAFLNRLFLESVSYKDE